MALQEVTPKTAILISGNFRDIGLHHVQDSLALVDEPPLEPPRPFGGVLIASRWPFRILSPAELGIPWPERALSIMLDSPWGEIELHAVYVPEVSAERKSGNPLLRTETFEGLFWRVARESKIPRILCGDLNAPREENASGSVVPFGRPGRCAAAELNVLQGLAAFDLPDVYRSLHGFGRQDFSWYSRHRDELRGFRLDHVLAARSLNALECLYLHAWREEGLSDHSAIEVRFAPNLGLTA